MKKKLNLSDSMKSRTACIFLVIFFIAVFIISYNVNHVLIKRTAGNYKKTIYMDEISENPEYIYAMQLDKEELKEQYAGSIIDEVKRFFAEVTDAECEPGCEVLSVKKVKENYLCRLNCTFDGDAGNVFGNLSEQKITVLCNGGNMRILIMVFENNFQDDNMDYPGYDKALELKKQEILSQTDNTGERYPVMRNGGVRERYDDVYEGLCRYNGISYDDDEMCVLFSMNDDTETVTLIYERQMTYDPEDVPEDIMCKIEFDIISGKIIRIESFD